MGRRTGNVIQCRESEHLRVLNRPDRLEETEPCSEMKDTPVPITKSHRHVGPVINRQLSWKDHINTVYTSCAPKVGMLNRLGTNSKETLCHVFTGAASVLDLSIPAQYGVVTIQ